MRLPRLSPDLYNHEGGALYILRHGATDGDGVKRYIGRTDIPLSAAGCRQADQWAALFATLPLQRIVCSDLVRSRQTAAIIGRRCTIDPEIRTCLREIDLGRWEGLSFRKVREQYPEEYEKRGRDPGSYRPPGGESFQDVRQRVSHYFDNLFEETSGNVLFAGHAGVNRTLLCHLLKIPLQSLFGLGQDYGGLSVVTPKRGGWRLVLLNFVQQVETAEYGSLQNASRRRA